MDSNFYDHLADWWPLWSPPSDYAEEAAFYARTLLDAGDAPARTLLELGSGGGNNASFMRQHFDLTLVELSPGMLDISRALNPACEHLQGDMRTVRLGRQFDRVFIQDAICYMATLEDLRAAIETAWAHCRPGGAVLLAPDAVKETFRPEADHGGADGEGRSLRYLEWSYDPDPGDDTCVVDFVFMLREGDGPVRVHHETHVEGLFPRARWLALMGDVGFEARVVPFDHSELEPGTYELFVGVKPA